MKNEIMMGDKVIDVITGFTGRVVSKHSYIAGYTRLSVQPKVNKDGTLPNTQTFDEPMLKLKTKKNTKLHQKTGGPSKYEDRGRMHDARVI